MLGSMTSEYFLVILLENLFSMFDVRDFFSKINRTKKKKKSVENITLTDTSLLYVSLGGGALAPY